MLHFLFRHVIWWLLRKLQPVYFTKILWNTLQNNLCSFHSHYFPSVPFSAPCLSYLPFSIILIQTFFFFLSFVCSFVTLYYYFFITVFLSVTSLEWFLVSNYYWLFLFCVLIYLSEKVMHTWHFSSHVLNSLPVQICLFPSPFSIRFGYLV